MGAKQRARRKRREEELEEEEPQRLEEEREGERERTSPAREPTATERVLELQKTAGNRATTEAISRWPLPGLPLAAAPQWPKEPQVIVDGKAIPLLSWSFSDSRSGGISGTSATGPGMFQSNNAQISTKVGDHSSDLMRKATGGGQIKTVVVVGPGKDGKGITFTFTDVLITAYSISGNDESWSISFEKHEFSQAPPPVKP